MNTPRLLKGGFVYYASGAAEGKVITFQYNPELLKRTIIPMEGSVQPKETISLTLELDASDALEHADPAAVSLGLHPALAALELLVQPQEQSGWLFDFSSWFSRKSSSLVLFVWGAQRVIPVRVLELMVSEQMFDPRLNPLRASVDVTLETLTDASVKSNPRAQALMASSHGNKAALARQSGSVGSAEDLLRDEGP
jgi:hypothetical protein